MTPALQRLTAAAIVLVLVSLAVGGGWELVRFGTSPEATARRLEQEVRRQFAFQARRVESLARTVAVEGEKVRAAAASPDALPSLFERLIALASPTGLAGASATVYVPTGPSEFRVLAWSDGPAEDLPADRLAGEATLFVVPATSGLRLVAVHPIQVDGGREGMAAAEAVLSAPAAEPGPVSTTSACTGTLITSYGPVEATAPCGGAGQTPLPREGFLVSSGAGEVMLEVHYRLETLEDARSRLRRQVAVAASAPLVGLTLLFTALGLTRRGQARTTSNWLIWTAVTAGAVIASAAAAAGLSSLVNGQAVFPAITGLAGLALAALVAGGWWWRPVRRQGPAPSSVRFVIEHLAGGLLVTGALWLLIGQLQGRISAASRDVWQLPLFPFDLTAFLYLFGTVLIQIAVAWTIVAVLAALAARWRLGRRQQMPSVMAFALWTTPTGLALVMLAPPPGVSPMPGMGVVVALAVFGLLAGRLRRTYRRATQATRLILLFAALVAPPLASYPLTAAAADRAARHLIETEFAPAILRQPEEVLAALGRAQQEIDSLAQLAPLIDTATTGDGASAYAVWSQTSLATGRLTSEVELFGADRRLVSRFALNVPEYPYGIDLPTWSGAGCEWDVFGEVARTGAVERVMLHAERGVCAGPGNIVGAIVVHAVSDYRALPFVSSGSPYAQALGDPSALPLDSRLTGLEVAVYGWNDDPQFTSGGVAWPMSPDVSARLYASREPFWTPRTVGATAYAVHYVNDRRGFYALGYPTPVFMEHATRLAEITAVVGALLVILLLGATAYAPVLEGHRPPLPALFHEIRTSFYRKLFLFFVLAAVGPVVLLALAFGAYTASRVRADVESEAASVVTVTRRLFEEFKAFDEHPDQQQAPPTDALLVLIRQMTNQDVNLYIGPRLVATSQRDLFDSGLLPTRTPASVYREIALNRLPTYVGEDRLGRFTYLVAAAPIPAHGRDAVISVPLGTRQREIEREIDELNRRVLVGAVVVVLFAAGLGATVAGRVADPVARLSRAARQIAAGRLDVRIVADTADELRRLVDDFNTMASTLARQRSELARTNQLKAWAQMARQVAHEIKNPLTPIQLAVEHLQRVHQDQQQPLGPVFDQCATTVLGQVRLLRQIASEFSNFASEPTPRFEVLAVQTLIDQVVAPYRPGIPERICITVAVADGLPRVRIDRTLVARALTNLIENAIQATPGHGDLRVSAGASDQAVHVTVADTGVGMDREAASRAFEPYFSTKTGGSGLGLPNAKRYVELSGGTMTLVSDPGRGTTITVQLPVATPGTTGPD